MSDISRRKVLIVITTDFVIYGGLTTVMMNYYRAMNKENLQIDFASTNNPSNELKNELEKNNSRYFNLGNRKKSTAFYLKKFVKLLIHEKYDVIHVNGNSSTMVMELMTAKMFGIKTRISHVHTTCSNYPYINKILRPLFLYSYNVAIAVSKQAGEWLYGKKFIVLNNAIDTNKYKFNMKVREELRSKYGLNNKFVVGNVGKLYPPKNQSYLLKIFAEYCKVDENAMLVIAGGGVLEDELKKEAERLFIKEKVIFLGMCNDVPSILQMFDIFVFPSIFEGLGLAIIEAQASGLPCIASKAVPMETQVTSNIYYYNLDGDEKKWINGIEDLKDIILHQDRKERSEIARMCICENGYEIRSEVEKLEKIYTYGFN